MEDGFFRVQDAIHDPTTSEVMGNRTGVLKYPMIVAPGFLKGIGKDR